LASQVLAVDCLLIETLGAFVDGLTDTDGKSKETFCNFLITRQGFKNDFTPDFAKRFYKDFRCGVLHQAETRRGSKVWSVGNLIWEENGELIVNRNELHDRLKREFEVYLNELQDPINATLRAKFENKMNFISRS
jgi:hypothetical protein